MGNTSSVIDGETVSRAQSVASDTAKVQRKIDKNFILYFFYRLKSVLVKPLHQDFYGQLLGTWGWSTGTALHLILF